MGENSERRYVNTFGNTAEESVELVTAAAKRMIDEQIEKARQAGKQSDGTWGMRLTGSGNFQYDTYMPYIELREPDAAADATPEIIQLTNSPVTQAQSEELAEYYFDKIKTLEN